MERTPSRTSGSRPVVAMGWNSWNTIWNLRIFFCRWCCLKKGTMIGEQLEHNPEHAIKRAVLAHTGGRQGM
jgi:hypothetical protein